jgi:hypothetical protein
MLNAFEGFIRNNYVLEGANYFSTKTFHLTSNTESFRGLNEETAKMERQLKAVKGDYLRIECEEVKKGCGEYRLKVSRNIVDRCLQVGGYPLTG